VSAGYSRVRRLPQQTGRRLLIAGGLAVPLLGIAGVACADAGPDRTSGDGSVNRKAPADDPGSTVNEAPAGDRRATTIGRSQGGHPINVTQLGGDRRRVLVLGGQHGSPEANAVDLANAVLAHFAEREAELPKGVGLDVITIANPDGFIAGSRQFQSGIDPNRNWASGDWEPDAYDSLGRFTHGLGGPVPMSEPETRQLASWIARRRPAVVVNYHSAGGFVSTGQDGRSWELASTYATASGYPCYGPDRQPFGYRITGAMDGWLAGRGIADIFVELTTLDDAEIEENLAGLSAVLARLST
jgi:hypothetical protein